MTAPLTGEEIAELRRLDRDVKPGRWMGIAGQTNRLAGQHAGDAVGRIVDPENLADLRLALAARNALPRLLDEVERARAGAVTIRLEEDCETVPFSVAAAEVAADALAQLERVRALLKRIEWKGTWDTFAACPECVSVCTNVGDPNHHPGCELATLLGMER